MYQLIVQFRASAVDLDDLIAVEDELLAAIEPSATVDGHDFGSGEGNIFILTDTPVATAELVVTVLGRVSRDRDATVAYRRPEGGGYTVVWPKGFTGKFSVA